jgi:hypothetical protein
MSDVFLVAYVFLGERIGAPLPATDSDVIGASY